MKDESERVLPRELYDARANVALDHAERTVVKGAVRIIEVDVVQGIEELKPQLKTLLFPDIELAAQCDVNVEIAGPSQRI
jgi:hypothetical protein